MKKVSIIVVIAVVILLSVGLFIVIKSYTNQFGTNYSKNLNDWSSFADYLGGIGNTLISLASLIIIGLISILLGRDKNDYKFEQRNKAYDDLIAYVPKFNLSAIVMAQINSILGTQVSWISEEIKTTELGADVKPQKFTNQRNQITLQYLKEFNAQLAVFYEYRFNLKNFNPRYQRFFKKYKFGTEYEELLKSAEKLTDDLEEYKNILSGKSVKQIDDIPLEESINAHIELLTNFINDLHREL
jgi:hypothetical protein